jgi:membrane protease YdiL (CAAX protease family)
MELVVIVTFTLLALALCALWLPPLALRRATLTPWALLFLAACAAGLAAGVLAPMALAWLVLLAGAAWLAAPRPVATPSTAAAVATSPAASGRPGIAAAPRAARSPALHPALRVAALLATAVLALALAMHLAPGFRNPIAIASTVLSPGAAPFQQYANFDKGAVGLILLAFLCRRCTSAAELAAVLKRSLPLLAATLVGVMGFALAIGYVRPDLKLGHFTAIFLATNLFFTVMAEEAFFRGLVQGSLASALGRWRHGGLLAVAGSALLFGLAHAGGGPAYVALAGIAGLGYGWAVHASGRIEAGIFLHFSVNALHFIFFTYPYLAH